MEIQNSTSPLTCQLFWGWALRGQSGATWLHLWFWPSSELPCSAILHSRNIIQSLKKSQKSKLYIMMMKLRKTVRLSFTDFALPPLFTSSLSVQKPSLQPSGQSDTISKPSQVLRLNQIQVLTQQQPAQTVFQRTPASPAAGPPLL